MGGTLAEGTQHGFESAADRLYFETYRSLKLLPLNTTL